MTRVKCKCCQKKLDAVQATCGVCKCGFVFCSQHRLPESHECSYDHRKDGLAKLQKQMDEAIVPQKVQMI
jgi:predicted nucleic acid binding AN1-type Zn finger protein